MSKSQARNFAEDTLNIYTQSINAWADDVFADDPDFHSLPPLERKMTRIRQRLTRYPDTPLKRANLAMNKAYTNALYNLKSGYMTGFETYRNIANPPLARLQAQLGSLKYTPDSTLEKRYTQAQTRVLEVFNKRYFFRRFGERLNI
ncbi:hypothetical protein [Lactiplantibacillus carotarum]|uniref:hypothetical protein n=1 Tax=Lactiplantibacillus carotarum TaxID=2993456 RepID=UPI00298F2F97|nr:hypothetical protein [Lactiplantibacillus carotarum]